MKETDVSELSDFEGSLKQLKSIVDSLITKHGVNSKIRFYAGYNNISCLLVPSKTKQNENPLSSNQTRRT